MFSGTMSDEKVVPLLGEFVCMGAKRNDDAGKQLIDRFHVETVPTLLFVGADGKVVDVIAGYVPVAEFTAEIERIKLGHPQQNGRHERMHLTLKKETTRPPGINSLQQQARFDDVLKEFNH